LSGKRTGETKMNEENPCQKKTSAKRKNYEERLLEKHIMEEKNAEVRAVLEFMRPLILFKQIDGVDCGSLVEVEKIKQWIKKVTLETGTRRISSGDASVLKIQQPCGDGEWVEYQIRMRGKLYESQPLTEEEFSKFKQKLLEGVSG